MIFIMCILFAYKIYSDDAQIIEDAPRLITEIKSMTNGRWEVTACKSGMRIESKEQFLGWNITPCGKMGASSNQNYTIYFSFSEKIEPNKYKEILESNKNAYSSLFELAKSKFKNEQVKGDWLFYPVTEEDWKLFFQYDFAKRKLEDMPNYYYKGLGIKHDPYYEHYKAKDENDAVYKSNMNDVEKIFTLLQKY